MLNPNEIADKIAELKDRIEELNYMAIEATGKRLNKIETRIEEYEEKLTELNMQSEGLSEQLDVYYASIE